MLQDSIGSPQKLRRIRCEIAQERICVSMALVAGEERRVAVGGALALFAAGCHDEGST
jgi:hypothetical protein